MNILDVNVVLSAHRSDHDLFAVARQYIEELLANDERFSVPDMVVGSFVRLATNRRIFREPTPLTEAFEFLNGLRDRAAHVNLAPGAKHLQLLERLCRTFSASGDLVPDAQLAALAMENGAGVASFDRDFARFEGLRLTVPGS